MTSQDSYPRHVRKQAAEWAVLLSEGPLDASRDEALQRWLAKDVQHAEALDFARRTWAALAAEPARPLPRRSTVVRQAPRSRRQRSRARRWVAGLCALLLLGGLAINQQRLVVPMLADYRTVAGEVRTVRLPDGSEVTLDSASAIRLDYTDDQRRLELLAGAAVFEVAPQSDRPFIVQARDGTTRALGTRFLVKREDDDSITVGVLEHAVQVSAAGRRHTLEEGHSLRYGDDDMTPRALDLQRLTSWQRGLLIFERVPLSQVINELNLYRPGYIVIGDQALGQRQVSGVFRLDALDQALQTLTREMAVRQTEWLGVTLIY